MEPYLAWIIVGFLLVTVELLTGTFYLLVIGAGAFAGALVAWLGGAVLVQAVGACAVALVGAVGVRQWHKTHQKAGVKDNLLDLGQPVVLETWTNAAGGMARVKYRGASWDAKVADGSRPEAGATLYVTGQDGNTLLVGAAPASR
jgi:membrane protein implicated in regulation of membrane protease activity